MLNHAASTAVHFFMFDVLILAGRDVMGEPLTKRRELMERHIFPKLTAFTPIISTAAPRPF